MSLIGKPIFAALLVLAGIVFAAGCSSSGSSPKIKSPGKARSFVVDGFSMQLAPLTGVAAVEGRISFSIKKPDGKILKRFKTGNGPHTGVHLIYIKKDLSQIVHHHPPLDSSGLVSDKVKISNAGKWRLLIDVYPEVSKSNESIPKNFQLTKELKLEYGGSPTVPAPLGEPNSVAKSNGYTFKLGAHEPIRAAQAMYLPVTITSPTGKPITIEPWFGATAHAIFFRNESLDYFHTHVCAPDLPECSGASAGSSVVGQLDEGGSMQVGVLLPVPGKWRLFIQCKVDGKELSAPFTLKVE